LVRDISPFDFRGFGLERAVAGFDRLGLSGVRLHPIDAGRLGVEAGDEIVIAREGAEIRGPAIIDRSIPEHAAYLTVASGAGIPYPFVPGPFAANPCAVEIRRGNPA
jgi:anaerobic selenocysteine-containing dehydrogenase